MSQMNSALKEQFSGPIEKVNTIQKHPIKTQERVLTELLTKASETEWGRRYQFNEILKSQNVRAAFRDKLPVKSYEDFKESFTKICNGQKDIIWPGTFSYFAITSGTMSPEGKLFPISIDTLNHYIAFGADFSINHMVVQNDFRAMSGKILSFSGYARPSNRIDTVLPADSVAGEISGLLAHYTNKINQSQSQKSISAVPPEVMDIEDPDEKEQFIIDHAIRENVTVIGMIPYFGHYTLQKTLDVYNRQSDRKVTHIGEIWPNLNFVISSGISLTDYRKRLDELIGIPDLKYVETYGATEGYFAFQNDMDDDSLLLHLDCGVYYEFVRCDDEGQIEPHKLTLEDVEENVPYIPVISTSSGLWSYAMNDIVYFTGLSPFKIKVVGRLNELMTCYYEYVSGKQLKAAVEYSSAQNQCEVFEFHVAPIDYNRKNIKRHDWHLEFVHPPSDLAKFARDIDDCLIKEHSRYSELRSREKIAAPSFNILKKGSFVTWLRTGKIRALSTQTKIPKLREDRQIADELKPFIVQTYKLGEA